MDMDIDRDDQLNVERCQRDANLLLNLIIIGQASGKYMKDPSLVIDVGCGPGAITKDMHSLLNAGKVVGLDNDIDELTVALAQNTNEKTSYHHLDIEKASSDDIDKFVTEVLGGQKADIIITSNLLNNIDNDAVVHGNILRLLKDGGHAFHIYQVVDEGIVHIMNRVKENWPDFVPDEYMEDLQGSQPGPIEGMEPPEGYSKVDLEVRKLTMDVGSIDDCLSMMTFGQSLISNILDEIPDDDYEVGQEMAIAAAEVQEAKYGQDMSKYSLFDWLALVIVLVK